MEYKALGTCASNVCLNGGTCVNSQTGGYTCLCTSFYGGSNCQTCKKLVYFYFYKLFKVLIK